MITINVKKSIKLNDENSIFVSFPYNPTILEIIKSFSKRYWIPETKEWELPLNKIESLAIALKDFEIEIKVQDASVFAKKELPKVDYNFVTNPYPYQLEGFNYGLSHDKWLLGDEQGLGKSKQVIDIAVARKIQYGYKHCLVICGVNGLKWNWVNEVNTHSNESAWVLGQRYKKNGSMFIDGNQAKFDDLCNIQSIDSYFIITNVETLRSEEINEKLIALCKDGTFDMIAADEVHKMKNPTSQQGKAFLKLQTKTMIAMTGTPLMNTPLDLYIIFKWLGYEDHSFYSFKNHYCEMGGYGNYQIVGYKHLNELQAQLDEIMLRRLKSDVLADLPEKIFVDEYVEMTAKQEQIYKEIMMDILSNIDLIKQSNNPLAELIRMRQATGYTGILSSTIKESAKLDRMEELVDDSIQNGKQVVIFSNWTQITDQILNRLRVRYHDVSVITGETKDAERQEMVNKFQDGKNRIIIGTVGAMGTGLTLTAGTVEIFMDEPWTMAAKEQAIDRCHRIGQKSNITIYTLLAKNTIDERVHEIVLKKGKMANAIVDNIESVSKSDLVDYLLS